MMNLEASNTVEILEKLIKELGDNSEYKIAVETAMNSIKVIDTVVDDVYDRYNITSNPYKKAAYWDSLVTLYNTCKENKVERLIE